MNSIIFLTLLSVTLYPTYIYVNGVLIPLPEGGRAEGVAHLRGTNFVASDFFTGNVFLVDVASGLAVTIVRAPPGRYGIGLHASEGYIFVAGGGDLGLSSQVPPPPTPGLYAYSVSSGLETGACPLPAAGFVNDVVADARHAYFTDSTRPQVYRLDINSLPRCNITTLQLPPDLFGGPGFFSNGIVKYQGGLIIANSQLQTIFFVDLLRRNRVSRILPNGTIPSADGLFITPSPVGPLLYVAQFTPSIISVWRLSINRRIVSASRVGRIVRPRQFANPATVAVAAEYLVAANFNTTAPLLYPSSQQFNLFSLRLEHYSSFSTHIGKT